MEAGRNLFHMFKDKQKYMGVGLGRANWSKYVDAACGKSLEALFKWAHAKSLNRHMSVSPARSVA